MKKLLQKILPYSVKLQLKLLQRKLQEQKKQFNYSQDYLEENLGTCQFEINQPIKEGLFFENKVYNLKLVGEKINNLIIKPNEVFSFWKLVGKPTAKKGFKKGRNLINGEVSDDFGGGICQFSSILYYLALQTGFKIIERNAHSLDIYKEDERFTPLGGDSTVVFGYKDLQFQNMHSFPTQLKSEISENTIILKIFANNEIQTKNVQFDYINVENGVEVDTKIEGNLLYKNFYKRL